MEANFYGEGNGVRDNETRTCQEGDLEAESCDGASSAGSLVFEGLCAPSPTVLVVSGEGLRVTGG